MKEHKKKIIAAILIAAVVIVAVILWAGITKGKSYSRSQATSLATYNIDETYAQLSDSAKEEYGTIEEFFDEFVYYTDFEEDIDTSTLKLMGVDGNILSRTRTYLYQLRRSPDSTEGYLIGITVSGLPFSPSIDGFSYQEADIMLKAGEQE